MNWSYWDEKNIVLHDINNINPEEITIKFNEFHLFGCESGKSRDIFIASCFQVYSIARLSNYLSISSSINEWVNQIVELEKEAQRRERKNIQSLSLRLQQTYIFSQLMTRVEMYFKVVINNASFNMEQGFDLIFFNHRAFLNHKVATP